MNQAVEYVCCLRYKIQTIGIMCEDPAFFYGDNKLVVANTTVPDYTMKMNMNILSYQFVHEGCARDEWRTAYVNTNCNLADLLTNLCLQGRNDGDF